MNNLPPYLPVQAALILIATRIPAACLESFEANETLPRSPFSTENDKVAAWVPVPNFGLTAVSVIIAKYQHPQDRTIRDKWGTFKVLDDGSVHPNGKKRDTAAIDYEYALAERELLRALRAKNITAYTIDSDNVRREIDAALWLGREFDAEVGEDGHYHVVATATGKEPLRDIVFKKDDILRKWPPEGGQELGSKVVEEVRRIRPLEADTAKVEGYKSKQQHRWELAKEFLANWKPEPGAKNPFYRLRARTIDYVAQEDRSNKGAITHSIGKSLSEEIKKMREAFETGNVLSL